MKFSTTELNAAPVKVAPHSAVSRRQVLGTFVSAAAAVALPARAGEIMNSTPPVVALAVNKLDGVLYKATAKALYSSRDAGRSWQETSLPLAAGARITAISVSAANPSIMYATAAGLGLQRSADAGATWERIGGRTLPSGVTVVSAHSSQADTVYAYVPRRGFYRSEDGGSDWQLMDAGPRGGIGHFVHSDMAGSMQTGWLFAAGPHGVRMSMDCFCGWREAGDLAASARAVTYNPGNPAHVATVTRGGLYESKDGGQVWTQLPAIDVPPTTIAFGPDGILYAAGANRLFRRTTGKWQVLDA